MDTKNIYVEGKAGLFLNHVEAGANPAVSKSQHWVVWFGKWKLGIGFIIPYGEGTIFRFLGTMKDNKYNPIIEDYDSIEDFIKRTCAN